MTESDYRALVAWTWAASTPDKAVQYPHALSHLALNPRTWPQQVTHTETAYARAVGSLESLTTHAKRLGQRTVRGIGFRRRLAQRAPNNST